MYICSAGAGRELESSEVGVLAADFGAPAEGLCDVLINRIVNVFIMFVSLY